jgi:hypothetical protein
MNRSFFRWLLPVLVFVAFLFNSSSSAQGVYVAPRFGFQSVGVTAGWSDPGGFGVRFTVNAWIGEYPVLNTRLEGEYRFGSSHSVTAFYAGAGVGVVGFSEASVSRVVPIIHLLLSFEVQVAPSLGVRGAESRGRRGSG